MQIIAVASSQPRRITLAATGTPSTTVTDYAIERQDGGYSSVGVTLAWLVNANTVELALGDALIDGVVYVVSMPNDADTPSAAITYRGKASTAPPSLPKGEDPAAEAYGVSIDWLSGHMTGTGDLVEVRGRQCYIDDLIAIAMIEPGELFHRPDDGGALPSDVNGPAIPSQVQAMRSRLKRQWLKDARTKTVDSIDIIANPNGQVQMRCKITDAVSGEQVSAQVPGGVG